MRIHYLGPPKFWESIIKIKMVGLHSFPDLYTFSCEEKGMIYMNRASDTMIFILVISLGK